MYYIINKSTGKYLTRDSGKTSVSAQTKANSNRQLWEVTKVGGVYQIKNINSSQYLGSPNGQPFSKNASPVIRTVAQKWRIVKNPGSGTYRIFAQNSQYSLENNSSLQSGTLVRATDFTTSDTRKWEFVAAVDQVAVKWPNGTFLQKRNPDSSSYKNETGVALEVGKSKQVTVVTLDGNIDLQAPYSISVSDTSKIRATYSGRTITITGKAKGTTSIMIMSGTQSVSLPVVVADKVLDVPHIRQEQDLWCWAACAQMVANFYNPDNTGTQSAMVKCAHNNTLNRRGGADDIIKIITEYGKKTLTKVTRSNFGGETSLRQKLDSGKPVIYLSNRVNSEGETKGHYRVIYGYYKQSDNKYVYLIYDPWDPVKYANNSHFDYWRRSWQNILDEEDIGISGIDKLPKSGFTNYSGDWFIY